MRISWSQQQVLNEENEVTLLMKPILEEVLLQKQLQHILGLYLKLLFDAPQRSSLLQHRQQKWKMEKLSGNLESF
ncbi:unnamed protein product [Caretta caretta]